ncbi:MAG: hypothetical protein ACK417_05795 [Bacteroidia bacterium]
MRKKLIWIALIMLVFQACREKAIDLSPNSYWSAEVQDSIKFRVLPYVAKLPKRATHEMKWDERFIPYYKGLMGTFSWRYVWPADDGSYFFMLDRPAASLFNKRIAIAGRIKFDSTSYEIETYEEAFWTFKFKEPELTEKTEMLFKRYIKGESLDAYLPMNSFEEYIEFPDSINFYNKELRRWNYIWEKDNED